MILTNPSLRVRLTWQNIKLEIPSYSGLCNCNNGSRPKKNYVQGTLMWRFGINFTRVVVKQQKEKRHVFTMNSRPRYQNCACACTFARKAVLNSDTIMEKRQAVALGGKARGDNSFWWIYWYISKKDLYNQCSSIHRFYRSLYCILIHQ